MFKFYNFKEVNFYRYRSGQDYSNRRSLRDRCNKVNSHTFIFLLGDEERRLCLIPKYRRKYGQRINQPDYRSQSFSGKGKFFHLTHSETKNYDWAVPPCKKVRVNSRFFVLMFRFA